MKPMLASKCSNLDALQYPVLASPKLDGIRCLIINGQPFSRNLKPIRNSSVHDRLEGLPAMDGELVVGSPTGTDVWNRSNSGVMAAGGVPEFTYWVFDVMLRQEMGYAGRHELVKSWCAAAPKWVKHVPHKLITSAAELRDYEEKHLLAGYEGVMVRSTNGPYKYGRATEREGYLLKVKRFEDSEAVVLGFVEKMHNDNELQRDELGRAKRSSHKANKREAGTLGALAVRDIQSGVEFEIGTGFDDATRAAIWAAQADHAGRLVKYKFQPTGVKDKPRFPVFMGFRDAADLD
jgi:DNA ligase-1